MVAAQDCTLKLNIDIKLTFLCSYPSNMDHLLFGDHFMAARRLLFDEHMSVYNKYVACIWQNHC